MVLLLCGQYLESPESSNIATLFKASGLQTFIETTLDSSQATATCTNHCNLFNHGGNVTDYQKSVKQ